MATRTQASGRRAQQAAPANQPDIDDVLDELQESIRRASQAVQFKPGAAGQHQRDELRALNDTLTAQRSRFEQGRVTEADLTQQVDALSTHLKSLVEEISKHRQTYCKLELNPQRHGQYRRSIENLEFTQAIPEIEKILRANNGPSGAGVRLHYDLKSLLEGKESVVTLENTVTKDRIEYRIAELESKDRISRENRLGKVKEALLNIAFVSETKDLVSRGKRPQGLDALCVDRKPVFIPGQSVDYSPNPAENPEPIPARNRIGNLTTMGRKLEELLTGAAADKAIDIWREKAVRKRPESFLIVPPEGTLSVESERIGSDLGRGARSLSVIAEKRNDQTISRADVVTNQDYEGRIELSAKNGTKLSIELPTVYNSKEIDERFADKIEAFVEDLKSHEETAVSRMREYYSGCLTADRYTDEQIGQDLAQRGVKGIDQAVIQTRRDQLIADELEQRCLAKRLRETIITSVLEGFAKEDQECSGKGIDLRHSKSVFDSIFRAEYSNLITPGIRLENALIDNTIEYDAKLGIDEFHFSSGSFAGSKFSNVTLNRVDMDGANFALSEWRKVKMVGRCMATGAAFSNADWYDCELDMRLNGAHLSNLDMHDSRIRKGGVLDLSSAEGLNELTGDWKRRIEATQREYANKRLKMLPFAKDWEAFVEGFKVGWVNSEGLLYACIDMTVTPEDRAMRAVIGGQMQGFINGGSIIVDGTAKGSWDHNKSNFLGYMSRGRMYSSGRFPEEIKLKHDPYRIKPTELIARLNKSKFVRTTAYSDVGDESSIIIYSLDEPPQEIHLKASDSGDKFIVSKYLQEGKDQGAINGDYVREYDDPWTAQRALRSLINRSRVGDDVPSLTAEYVPVADGKKKVTKKVMAGVDFASPIDVSENTIAPNKGGVAGYNRKMKTLEVEE